jgi:hypothetical protein
MVVVLGLIAALLAQAGVFAGDGPTEHPDPLTTLTLVLAILAFLIQIFVFVFQTNANSRATQRSKELNSNSHVVLDKIEANSAATQKVLFSQFDRLLDYIVGAASGVAEVAVEQADEIGEEEDESPVTTADVSRMIADATTRLAPRPIFPAGQAGVDIAGDARRMYDVLKGYPSRAAFEQAVATLESLSPLAIASLTRLASATLDQIRGGGTPRGLGIRKAGMSPTVIELVDAGLFERRGNRVGLTDLGAQVASILPIGKSAGVPLPDWAEEARAPLLQRPSS